MHLLQEEFNIEKPGTKLENWPSLSFGDFLRALKAKRITLTGQNKEDWHERFRCMKPEIAALDTNIAKAEQELNRRVYALYSLTDKEIAFIQGTNP